LGAGPGPTIWVGPELARAKGDVNYFDIVADDGREKWEAT